MKNIMQWMYEKGCHWGECTFAEATIRGDLVNMQWLYEKGCPWDSLMGFREYADDRRGTISEDTIQWLLAHGCPEFLASSIDLHYLR